MESILRTRHSARKFLDKSVDESLIREIIADAQQAPSWCNSQPWKAYVATGDAAKKIVKMHTDNVINKAKAWAEVVPPQFGENDWTQAEWKNMRNFWDAADVSPDGGNDKLGLQAECNCDFHAPVIVYINGELYQVNSSHIPYDLCPDLYKCDFSGSVSLHQTLREHGIFPYRADQQVLIGMASAYDALHLEIEEGSPVTEITTITTDKRGGIIEYVTTKSSAYKTQFEITIFSEPQQR